MHVAPGMVLENHPRISQNIVLYNNRFCVSRELLTIWKTGDIKPRFECCKCHFLLNKKIKINK